MKNVTITKLCVISTLTIALMVAWVSSTPCWISGNKVEAGWTECKTVTSPYCPPKEPGDICPMQRIICVDPSGGKDCVAINLDCFHTKCQRKMSYACL